MNKQIDVIYKQAQESDGLITTKEIEGLGIGRYNIKGYVSEGLLVRESKGIYSVAKEMPDEYAAIQKRSQKAIYSYGKLVGNYDNNQIFQGEKNLIIVLTLISKKSQI